MCFNVVRSYDSCCCSVEYNARCQDKFILLADTLSSRQLNCVRSLVRLGSEPLVRSKIVEQVKHIQYWIRSKLDAEYIHNYVVVCCLVVSLLQ